MQEKLQKKKKKKQTQTKKELKEKLTSLAQEAIKLNSL